MHINSRRAAGISLLLTLAGLAGASPSAGGTGVCDGAESCEVVAHTDVDGDGTKDQVGVAPGTAEGTVDLHVLTASGVTASATRTTSVGMDDVWQGKARLDGRKGRELLLTDHYQTGDRFYHVLTWRKGQLVTLAQPGGGDAWQITGNGRGVRGFQRSEKMPVGTIRERFATPADDTGDTYDGTRTTYTWKKGAWKKIGESSTTISGERAVLHWYGWHVDNLPAT